MFVVNSGERKQHTEQLLTDASLDRLQQVLESKGYKVQRTKFSITAQHGGTWSTNGKISRIQITDCGEYRQCTNDEESLGWLMNPKAGRLAEIISIAESN